MSVNNFLDAFFLYVFQDCCACPQKECTVDFVTSALPELVPKFCQKFSQYLACSKPSPSISNTECNKLSMRAISSLNQTKYWSYSQPSNFDLTRYQDLYLSQAETQFYKVHPRLKCVDILVHGFTELGLLRKSKNKFYLLGAYHQLSWKGIKALDQTYCSEYRQQYSRVAQEIVDYFGLNLSQLYIGMQLLFWYFRKAMVDSIAIDVLSSHTSLLAISVGSTNITSDYDITLYGQKYSDISRVINKFNRLVTTAFGKPPDFVFDTNMYGVSFIKLIRTPQLTHENESSGTEEQSPSKETGDVSLLNLDDFADKFTDIPLKCGDLAFTYAGPARLDNSPNSFQVKISQHIWALVKVFVNLEEIQQFDEKIYDLLRQILFEPVNELATSQTMFRLLDIAERLQQRYESSQQQYASFIKKINSFTGLSDADFNNFISFINYNGSETYFARGTFLDVVVNQQMCKQEPREKIHLSTDEYFDSFVENMADLMLHYHKNKYLNRAMAAWKRIGLDIKPDSELSMNFNQIKQIQTTCNGYNYQLLECSAFLFMYYCISAIQQTAAQFLSQYDPYQADVEKVIYQFEKFLEGEITETDSLSNSLSSIKNKENTLALPQSPLKKFTSAPDVRSTNQSK
jgi:hypothetical protein